MSPDAERILRNIAALLESSTYPGRQAAAVAEALSFIGDTLKANVPAQPAQEASK